MARTVGLVLLASAVAAGIVPVGGRSASAVANGTIASPRAEAPWAVAIYKSSSPAPAGDPAALTCSGTALDNRTVLTAAHCVEGLAPESLRVGYGAERLAGQATTAVTAMVVHPRYDPVEVFNDLAMLRTAVPMSMRRFPAVATGTHAARARRASARLTLYGWGQDQRGRLDGRLGKAVLRPRTNAARREWGSGFRASEQLAAGVAGRRSGHYPGACEGDSGGPLILGPARRAVLVGVTSFGRGGCGGSAPTILMSTGDYRQWIRATSAALASAG